MDKNTQQPVAYRWRFGSESIDTRWHYSDVPLVPYLDRTVECLYTAPPVPRDVLMAFGVEVADKAHAAGVIGNLFTDEDIAAIADRYASQVQPEPASQQMLRTLHHIEGAAKDIRVERHHIASAARAAIAAAEAAQPVVLEPVAQQADWKNFNDGYKAGAEEMRDGLLQLCKDFSDRQNRPYMGDVLAQVNSLCDLVLSEIPRSLEQQAEHNLTDIRCECCGYLTHQREHMGCIRAAHPPAVAVPDERAAFEAWLQEGIDGTDTVRPSKEKVDAYFAVWEARAMLSAAQKPEGGE